MALFGQIYLSLQKDNLEMQWSNSLHHFLEKNLGKFCQKIWDEIFWNLISPIFSKPILEQLHQSIKCCLSFHFKIKVHILFKSMFSGYNVFKQIIPKFLWNIPRIFFLTKGRNGFNVCTWRNPLHLQNYWEKMTLTNY